jgi:hypothetical protein
MNEKEKQPIERTIPRSVIVFSRERQDAWLKLYLESGNITLACEKIGINRQTFYNTVERDEEFHRAYQNAIDALCDNLEQVMLESAQALGKQGFMDRIAYLRAHRPDKFSDKVRVEHTSSADRVKDIISKVGIYKNVIEGELVESAETKREQLPAKEQPNP